MQIYEKLEPKRHELYISPEKIKIDGSPQATGKTITAQIYLLNHNKNNISFLNTHELIDEIYRNIYSNGFNKKINRFPVINALFGKTYLLNKSQMLLYGYDKCLCKLYNNIHLFKLMTHGYLTSDYCNNRCEYRYNCIHKEHIITAFNSHKLNFNNMCLSVKSYIDTDIIDGFLDSCNNLTGVFDENIFNLLYHQINIYPYHIDKFRDLVDNLIYKSKNNDLVEFWNDLEKLLSLIREIIKYHKNIKVEKKSLIILKHIIDFINSNSLKTIKKWNEAFKDIFIQYKLNFKIPNLLNSLIDIFEDMKKLKNGNIIKDRLIIDDDDIMHLSYYINKKDRIEDIFDRLSNVILTDATIENNTITKLFPKYEDNYIIFRGVDYTPKYKEVYIYKKDKKYGSYSKPVLWNKHKSELKKAFFILEKKVEYILEKHRNNKILLIAFKLFLKFLNKKLEKLIDYYNIDIKFDYYYNIEGKNIYKDRDIVILFGSAGKPSKVKQALIDMFEIDAKSLDKLFIQHQMIQGIERTRPILRPYKVICYMLTNECVSYFPNAIGFESLIEYEYRDLIDYIQLQGNITTSQIINNYFKNKKSKPTILKLLTSLQTSGLIKSRNSSGVGRPTKIWSVPL